MATTHPTASSARTILYASLNLAFGNDAAVPTRIKLLPAGNFAARDGRPSNMEGCTAQEWLLTDAAGYALVAEAQARQIDFVIDYEHQTLLAAENGKPAPAAGWFKTLEYIPNDGLYATDVRWTDAAAAMLRAGEYKYTSPVFPFEADTGEVTGFVNLALTNNPALEVLAPLAALSAVGVSVSSTTHSTKETHQMDKTAILVALGLPTTTTDDAALAALTDLRSQVQAKDTEIAALKEKQFDPAKHLPLDEHKKVADELAALTQKTQVAEHAQLLQAALADARILPANAEYWKAQPLAALQVFLKDAKPLAALATLQTAGVVPPADGQVQLTAEQQYVVDHLGTDPKSFAANA